MSFLPWRGSRQLLNWGAAGEEAQYRLEVRAYVRKNFSEEGVFKLIVKE